MASITVQPELLLERILTLEIVRVETAVVADASVVVDLNDVQVVGLVPVVVGPMSRRQLQRVTAHGKGASLEM